MRPALVQRQLTLAGVALLAALGAIALGRADQPLQPAADSPVAPTARWEDGRVAVFGEDRQGQETSCGVTLGRDTVGVAHPVLPCGVELVLSHGGRQVRTEVIAQAPVASGRSFEVTAALASELRLAGETVIRWRFPS